MEKIISEFTKQFKIGFSIGSNIEIKGDFQGICICGMGGSALPGSLVLSWVKEVKIPVIIHRDYGLPPNINKEWLFLAISHSGNTEETISATKKAIKKKMKCAIITSGGMLGSMAKKYKIPCAIMPPGMPPRLALGYQFSALAAILSRNKIIKCEEKELLQIEKNVNVEILKNRGKALARRIKGKIAIIYTADKLKALAQIWKTSLNENSKTPAFWDCFPELNHNGEVVGFAKNPLKSSSLRSFYFIILKSANDMPENKKRMDLTAETLRKQGIKGEILDLDGKNPLAQITSSIILANWASYFLALAYKINPYCAELIEEFKKKMRGGKIELPK